MGISKLKKYVKSQIITALFRFRILKTPVNRRVIYLMGHGKYFPNLGDQAQAIAIPLWIKKHFDREIIELTLEELEITNIPFNKILHRDDLIFMHSGGNFGDDWYATQCIREKVLRMMRENIIIQLPQTIHYSHGVDGQKKLEVTKEVLSGCKNYLLFGRDMVSAKHAEEYFPSTQVLARPDMVLSLDNYLYEKYDWHKRLPNKKISKVLFILRNDKEGVYSSESKNKLLEGLKDTGYNTTLWDTDVNDVFSKNEKINILKKYLEFIAKFDAVVTDRFHGLIFAVLTRVPTVVLATHNHKTTSAFNWFSKVNYLTLAQSNAVEDIVMQIKAFEQLDNYEAPDWNAEHFDPMALEVKEFMRKAKL